MIKFLNLNTQHQPIKKEIDSVFKKIIDKGEFIGGEEVEKFEKEFANFCRVKHAISVNSGTDALFLSLKALGVGVGDEVITTPFTFIATAEAIANCGATPVFVDIKSDTFNIDPVKIEEYLTKKTRRRQGFGGRAKAIMPVHLFGRIADMSEITKIAKKHKLYVVEDACQAVGAEYQGKKVGAFGDLGCFSFFPSKNLSAMGDGGMIVTNNKKLADKIKLLKNHGSSPKNKYKNLILGTNSRLDNIQATVLRIKLKHLKGWNKKRKEIAAYYTKMLTGIPQLDKAFGQQRNSNKNLLFSSITFTARFKLFKI